MVLNQSIDIYCERLDPGFWAEPVNAFSNIVFFIAAFWAWRYAIRNRVDDTATGLLVVLVALIGCASFLFHTLATVWAGIADSAAIGVFFLVYLYFVFGRFFAWPPLASASGVVTAAGAIAGFMWLMPSGVAGGPAPFNGSLQYAPVLLALVVLVCALLLTGHAAWRPVATATSVFVLSLVFRTLDLWVCARFTLGTHFLWHLLNGLVVALVLKAMIDHGRRVA